MVLFASILGFISGLVAGLLPGIHPNTLATMMSYSQLNNFDLAIAIAVSSAVNNVISLIPAIFLFIPDESNVLSVLPGQRMVNEGKGLRAIWISGASALITVIALIAVIPISFLIMKSVYDFISPFLAPIITLIVIVYILQEKGIKDIGKALFVFLLAGTLGFIILEYSILKEPLFVVFVGMFALSSLILSGGKSEITYQKWLRDENISKKLITMALIGVLLGAMADLLPAVGSPSQLATFGAMLAPVGAEAFLVLTTSISISHTVNSFVALYTIDKARIGATAIIRDLIGVPNFEMTVFLIILVLVSTAISVIFLWFLSIPFIRFLRKSNLKLINTLLFVYLVGMVFVVDGFFGLFIATVATGLGMLPPLLGVRRTHLMGFLIVPTLIFLWS